MSYSQGGLIQSLDYNTFAQGGSSVNHAVANINTVWGVGNGNKGYGQTTPVATVTGAVDTVTATQWSTLISRLNSILTHQSGSGSGITAPTAGATIAYLSALSGKITDGFNNRLLAATNSSDSTGQGSTTTTWNNNTSTVITRTVTFASADQARYFFNAGGKLIINFSATNTAGNSKGTDWVSLLGTKLSSLTFGSTTNARNGTGGTATTTNTNIGYWGLTTSYQTLIELTSASGATYGSNSVKIEVKSNGVQGSNADVGTIVTFQITLTDAAADGFDDTVNLSIGTNFTVRAPEVTNLSNTWGSQTFG
jgi:hypothetical protein